MDVAVLGVMIPIIALMIPIVAIWSRHQQKMAEMNAKSTAEMTAEKAAQYTGQIKDLEERVRVLERIVTDRGYDVSTQIEALRDQHRVESEGAGVPLDLARKEKA
ncbi:hypothetical protein [Pelagerythrobacter marinus]|uniref:hypothetical protein n=1 Tax=Pelagerythrobacter marinus TaxID=538382 RepID=UPI0020368983|nr:hypothetical protein [Pelagerythrobacter marinus]USA38442.1 hypothetical protein NCF86_08850 [Pelagerythrobacter marinus]WPZ07534.1 hypothetical protein T8T98_03195 [Pelagerythrobacter marinus]